MNPRTRCHPIVHATFDALRLIGLRDRLRCPNCSAVGTWKPHGGKLDTEDRRKIRRWLCKWCGYYNGPEGERTAEPSARTRAWALTIDIEPGDALLTPDNVLANAYPHSVWPWRG